MGLLIDRWRAIGAGSATLSIVEPNGVALAFYESLGFQLTGEREHGELVMRLEL
jgi:ribosomal protein S18 acetylase RimI-like enzyme